MPRIGLAAQLFGLAAGPSAWIAQLALNYGLSSYACYPGDTPRQDLPPPSEHAVLLAINLSCLAVAFIGLAVSFRAWRKVPDGDGRARFLTLCGLLSAAIFSAAILFNTPSALALRLCWSASR
ncbi:hypothetical protein [Phenylobacterium sp.]|jgi:hypothetical protein|uniref:hypothetical protein n=1 Tax=Phenylobacterium sp. TaxID=1871053 RepID=UPI002E3190FC|nr:hypothetical protein [Phenylobacterium sp.]HEX3365688.1 hypothetical protein [Phenylobacterium sp.]